MMLKKLALLFPLLAWLLLAAQCNNTATPPAADSSPVDTPLTQLKAVTLGTGEKLNVVVTSNIIGDMVRQVAEDNINLTILMPLGVDVHGYVPTPQDAVAISQAHLIFANGLNYEEFLTKLLANASENGQLVYVTTGLTPRTLSAEADHAPDETAADHEEDEHAHEEAEETHHHGGTDPHAWLTAVNGLLYVNNIKMALSAADPNHAKIYETNAASYSQKLQETEAWIVAQIATVPNDKRHLVTDHDALGYYADHYGLTLSGAVIPGYSSMAQPSAQELAALQEIIKSYQVKAIFVGTTVNPNLAQQVSQDTGTRLVSLYTESLGAAGSGAESYIDYLRYNTTTIIEGLK